MSDERTPIQRFRAFLDELDEQTRGPGEPPLREAVAQQARERLAEMNERHSPPTAPTEEDR
jgi:hypothetical protein